MSELLNLVGLSTAFVLYAMLLVMVIRAGPRPWRASAIRPAAAGDGGPRSGVEPMRPAGVRAAEGRDQRTVSVSDRCRRYSALGFLPAVVVQSVLRGERDACEVD
jgi:hypothetical protein